MLGLAIASLAACEESFVKGDGRPMSSSDATVVEYVESCLAAVQPSCDGDYVHVYADLRPRIVSLEAARGPGVITRKDFQDLVKMQRLGVIYAVVKLDTRDPNYSAEHYAASARQHHDRRVPTQSAALEP